MEVFFYDMPGSWSALGWAAFQGTASPGWTLQDRTTIVCCNSWESVQTVVLLSKSQNASQSSTGLCGKKESVLFQLGCTTRRFG